MNYCGGWLQPPSVVVLEGYGYVAAVSFGTTGGCPRTVVEVSMAVPRVVYRSCGTSEEHR
jgi:hypothetical protein